VFFNASEMLYENGGTVKASRPACGPIVASIGCSHRHMLTLIAGSHETKHGVWSGGLNIKSLL
jgi:hypothetical protein